FMEPTDRPQFLIWAMSLVICAIMCPTMSLIATFLFKEQKTFATFVQTFALNFPIAILYQMFYCGPFVRFIFRTFCKEHRTAKAAAPEESLS
ncbi:MAG: DUF2798 domain-containing protein, partial [Lachnospiraceae bacterium]